jgi:hypothetical protein
MVNYTDSQTASVTSVAGTQTTISTFNVPQGQSWLVTDLWCGGDTGTYSLNIDVYPQANFSYTMDSPFGGSKSNAVTDTTANQVRIPVSGPAQIIAQITGVAGAPCDFMMKYTSSGGPTN